MKAKILAKMNSHRSKSDVEDMLAESNKYRSDYQSEPREGNYDGEREDEDS